MNNASKKGANLDRRTNKTADMRNRRAQWTDEQIQQDNANVRSSMGTLVNPNLKNHELNEMNNNDWNKDKRAGS